MSAIDFAGLRVSHPLAAFCESRGIALRREGSGGRLVGRCPLHEEKSASFTVYSDGHFYCYGCGEHGDVTHLCAAQDAIPIGEAARKLNHGTSPVIECSKVAPGRGSTAESITKLSVALERNPRKTSISSGSTSTSA
jgi:DNA primase